MTVREIMNQKREALGLNHDHRGHVDARKAFNTEPHTDAEIADEIYFADMAQEDFQ